MNEEASVFESEKQILVDTNRRAADQIRDVDSILSDVKALYRYLKKHGADPTAVIRIIDILKSLKAREFMIVQKIDYLDLVSRKLANFDVSLFPNLQSLFNLQTGSRRLMLREHIEREHGKIHRKYSLKALVVDAKFYAIEFENALGNAVLTIANINSSSASNWVLKAIYAEKKLSAITQKIMKLEHKLLQITEGKMKVFLKLRSS